MDWKKVFGGFLPFFFVSMAFSQHESRPLQNLTLEELLRVPVVSASNTEELLNEAPATVIVLTHQQILQRGYTELSQILDDLPGMQLARPRGATYFKNYWRGFRNNIGEPFLVMIDGLIFNHLYFNTGDVLSTFPLSNIERVEIVYGPASSVYGPNAFMGVIHVITTKEAPTPGSHVRMGYSAGSFDHRIADLNYLYHSEDFRFSITARADYGEGNWGTNNEYEYTRDSYYSDRRLWGGFVDNEQLGGRFDSPHRNLGLDIRSYFKKAELGLHYFELDTGYGVEYAGDAAQNRAVWSRPDLSAYIRFRHPVKEGIDSTTLFRFRRSDVSSDSYFLEGYNLDQTRVIDFSYWQSLNHSWSVFQDFDAHLTDWFSLVTGFKYERKDLQKAYDAAFGPAVPAETADPSTYPFPRPFETVPIAHNRIETEDYGAYVQTRWQPRPGQGFHLGIRSDHNSRYGTAVTARGGYVVALDRWTFKALLGNAFQEPTPRLLYGGWRGSGSDPNLKPEKSRTLELSAAYHTGRFSSLASFYTIRNSDTIINIASGFGTVGGAFNVGEREVAGFDLHAQTLLTPSWVRELRLWGYYSSLLKAEEENIDPSGHAEGIRRIGDLADHQVQFGIATLFDEQLIATLRGRWVGSRPTVPGNPVRRVKDFATFDFSLVASDIGHSGIGVIFAVHNLTNARYFHPGVREANAGIQPGFFDPDGLWHGSQGFFSSLLPQPARSFHLTLRLNY